MIFSILALAISALSIAISLSTLHNVRKAERILDRLGLLMPEFRIDPDYREVPERIAEWYGREPNGRIVCSIVEFTETRVVVKAEVYRDGETVPAGVGHSYLSIPGTTPFTRGAELENAETSAAGRALVMAGIPAKNVASGDEIRGKASPSEEGVPAPSEGDLSSGGEGRHDGEGDDPNLPTLIAPLIAGPKDWAQASRELKTSGTITRDLVLRHLKTSYGVKSLEEIDTDMLRQAVSALVLAKRTVQA